MAYSGTAERKSRRMREEKKTPCFKIFLRQAIAALICFFILKYICSLPAAADFKGKIKGLTEKGISAENITESIRGFKSAGKNLGGILDKYLKNGDKENEKFKQKQSTEYVVQ